MTQGIFGGGRMRGSGLRGAVTALLLAAAGSGGAHAASGHVKIGVLTDLSGPYSAITGRGSGVAAQLAVNDFGGRGKGP